MKWHVSHELPQTFGEIIRFERTSIQVYSSGYKPGDIIDIFEIDGEGNETGFGTTVRVLDLKQTAGNLYCVEFEMAND